MQAISKEADDRSGRQYCICGKANGNANGNFTQNPNTKPQMVNPVFRIAEGDNAGAKNASHLGDQATSSVSPPEAFPHDSPTYASADPNGCAGAAIKSVFDSQAVQAVDPEPRNSTIAIPSVEMHEPASAVVMIDGQALKARPGSTTRSS